MKVVACDYFISTWFRARPWTTHLDPVVCKRRNFFKHPPYWDKPIGTLLNILHSIGGSKLPKEEKSNGWKFKMIVRSRVKTNCFCVVDMNKQNVWVWIFFNNHAKQKKTFAAWRSLLPFVSKQMIKIQKKVSNPISNAQLEVILLLNFTSFTQ